MNKNLVVVLNISAFVILIVGVFTSFFGSTFFEGLLYFIGVFILSAIIYSISKILENSIETNENIGRIIKKLNIETIEESSQINTYDIYVKDDYIDETEKYIVDINDYKITGEITMSCDTLATFEIKDVRQSYSITTKEFLLEKNLAIIINKGEVAILVENGENKNIFSIIYNDRLLYIHKNDNCFK